MATTTEQLVNNGPRNVFIGYSLRRNPMMEDKKVEPVFEGRSEAADKERFKTGDFASPYWHTFQEVMIVDPVENYVGQWVYKEKEKKSVVPAVANLLLSRYPGAWPIFGGQPAYSIRLMGFGMRLFLKILGEEATMADPPIPLPLDMWYGPTADRNHNDAEEAINPKDVKFLNTTDILRIRCIEHPKNWKPGESPLIDTQIAVQIARQLNFIGKVAVKPSKKQKE